MCALAARSTETREVPRGYIRTENLAFDGAPRTGDVIEGMFGRATLPRKKDESEAGCSLL